MNENWFSIFFRWFGAAILCFFGYVPAWIFYQVGVTLIKEPSKFDWVALLVLICTAALTYFFVLLAYRAFSGRGRKQDGGLLAPWAIKSFIHAFGVTAVLIVIFGIYHKELRPIVGGIGYLIAAYSALLTIGRRAKANELRNLIFSVTPEKLGLKPAENEVWGVLMETGYSEAVVSLVVLADGTVSLYFSNGGGIIGLGDYPEPKRIGKELIELAQKFSGKARLTKTFPMPHRTFTRFYLLTGRDVVSIEAKEDDLGNQRHVFSPLFLKAHGLISAIRLVDEQIWGDQGMQN